MVPSVKQGQIYISCGDDLGIRTDPSAARAVPGAGCTCAKHVRPCRSVPNRRAPANTGVWWWVALANTAESREEARAESETTDIIAKSGLSVFYPVALLGLLRGSNPGWLIKSNRESGDGFSDILIKPEDPDAGIVIEVKYAKEMISLDAACEAAMAQIKEKRYDEALRDEGRCDILAYGIAFCRKRCRVVGEKIND